VETAAADAIYDFVVEDVALSLLAPRSADALLDAWQENEEPPYWARIWEAAWGLCRYLYGTPAPGRLLELGCGIGAVGCFAAKLGWQVVMTDYQAEAIRYAAENLRRNGLAARLERADWRKFDPEGDFDLVVGSDILYDSTNHPILAPLLARFLKRGSAVVLADPGRPAALSFGAEREKEGWKIHLEFMDGPDSTVALYICESERGEYHD